MVETVEVVRQRIDIGADAVRCEVLPCTVDLILITCEKHLDIMCRLLLHRQDLEVGRMGLHIILYMHIIAYATLLHELTKDRVDPYDGVEDVWTGVALEGREFIEVEDVVLRRLIREITVLQCGEADTNSDGGCLLLAEFLTTGCTYALEDLFIRLLDQLLETEHTTLAGLKRLSVLAVHRTEADEAKLLLRTYEACLPCHTEELGIVEGLPAVRDVDVLIRMIQLLTLDDGPEVRGRIQCRTVRLTDHAWRNLLRIVLLCDVHHQCALGLIRKSFINQVLNQTRNVLLRVALSLPEVEVNVEVSVVLLQIRDGNLHDFIPYRTVGRVTILQLQRCLMCTLSILRMYELTLMRAILILRLRLCRGERIDLLQLGDLEICIELSAVLKLRDDEAHLKTPVTEMYVTDDIIALLNRHPLDRLTDDGRTKVADMERLRRIGSAVVDDDLLPLMGIKTEILMEVHLVQILRGELLGYVQVDEARHHR